MKRATGDVDSYIASQPDAAQAVLRRVRRIIRKALPGAEEAISYQIPAYRVDGRIVVYFAGWREHWSLYPVVERVRGSLGKALDGYEVRKGTVRFPLSEPIPAELVERIVRALAAEAEARRVTRERRSRGAAERRRTRR